MQFVCLKIIFDRNYKDIEKHRKITGKTVKIFYNFRA